MWGNDNDFDIYLNKYCTSYHLSPEEAIKHRLVQEVKAYYEEKKGGIVCEP